MPLTPEQETAYSRAAEALEKHEPFRDLSASVAEVARKAYRAAERKACATKAIEDIDEDAARLLRDCIARGEPLP
jgi:cob(I)alamin adenosyltransferase